MSSETVTIIAAVIAAIASLITLTRQEYLAERREFKNWLRDKQLEAFVTGVESLITPVNQMNTLWDLMMDSKEGSVAVGVEVVEAMINMRRAESGLFATMGKNQFTEDFSECTRKAASLLADWLESRSSGDEDAAQKHKQALLTVTSDLPDFANRFHVEIQPKSQTFN